MAQAIEIGYPGAPAPTAADFGNIQDYISRTRIAGSSYQQDLQRKQFLERAAAAGLDISDPIIQKLSQQAAGIEGGTAAGLAEQSLSELASQQKQRNLTQQQLSDFRTRSETQFLGAQGNTLEQALASPTSELGQLSSVLGKQTQGVFEQELRPQIEASLGARGLLNSGAANELFGKALGGLQRSRESALTQAFLGGKEQLRGLERSDILGNIGAQQQALAQAFGLQRMGITMQFQQNLIKQEQDLERELAEMSQPGLLQNILTGAQIAGNIFSLGQGGGGGSEKAPTGRYGAIPPITY